MYSSTIYYVLYILLSDSLVITKISLRDKNLPAKECGVLIDYDRTNHNLINFIIVIISTAIGLPSAL